jgi:plasmid stability protein
MARLTLDLTDELRTRLQARAAETGHKSIEEHVAALIRADVDSNDQDYGAPEHLMASNENLEAKLNEGLASPASEMSPADWDDMRRRFLQRHTGSESR